MISLATTDTLRGKATNATAVTYTASVLEIAAAETYKNVQGQLPSSTTTLYTVPASTQTLVKEILFAETSGVSQVVTLFINGTAASNRITQFTIVANGTAILTTDGVTTYDATGSPSAAAAPLTLTGDVTGTGTGTVATTLANIPAGTPAAGSILHSNVVAPATPAAGKGQVYVDSTSKNIAVKDDAGVVKHGVQTKAAVSHNFVTAIADDGTVTVAQPVAADVTGAVSSVTAADGSITIAGTATAPTVSRAALTGDATAPAGSNATTVAKINGTALSGLATGLLKNTTTTGVPSIAVAADVPTVAAGGTGPLSATDGSVTNSRAPTGTAGGGLSGTYPNPGVTTTPSGTPVGAARTLTTTTPLQIGGGASADLSADRTLSILAATTSAAGSMSAADKTTVNDLWYDVTNYGVTTSNSGATNTANMNTLIQTTAPAGATFFFPQTGANYPFNGAIVVTKNAQTFAGRGDFSSVLFQGSTTDDLFRVSDGIQNITFKDLGFWVTVTMVSGAAINTGTAAGQGVVGLQVINCGFQTFGGTWFDGIVMNGTRGGEVALISYCQMNGFTNHGIALVGNTTTPATTSALIIDNTTMNGQITSTTGAVAGIYIQQSGAVNISDSDVISCTNNLLLAPITSVNQVVASVYCINSFFDHSHGSCVKLGGTQPIVRCKFVSCSFTVCNDAAANYSAFEISNTATNPPGDIDLINCSFQNTFNNTATTNGLLITTGANIKIVGNNFNGWTNGIQATPSGAAGTTRLHIVANTIGPGTVSHSASTTGILLNAGAVAYGLVHIAENTFPATNPFQSANTTNISDAAGLGVGTAATGQRLVANNSGLLVAPTGSFATVLLPITTATAADTRGGWLIPSGVRSCAGRITVRASNTATINTLTAILKYGTNNSNADASIVTQGFTGTAVVGSGLFTFDWFIETSTTLGAVFRFANANAATGIANVQQFSAGTAAPSVTIATNVNNWLGVYFTASVASIVTIRSVTYETLSQ